MTDIFESWKQARAEAAVPDGFADRVSAAAARRFPERVRVGIAVAAGLIFALRIASTFLVFATI